MSVVVHFATELSGGAGDFAKNVHLTMRGLCLPSLMLTRDRQVHTPDTVSLRPMSRVSASWRARWLNLRIKLGLINGAYAIFGVEKAPVTVQDVQAALGGREPKAFVFYWISYFVDFDTIHALRLVYPQVPILFVCLDEALLTGACHYTHGCVGYQASCSQCPATSITALQRRIEQGFTRRQALMAQIQPIVLYPTTALLRMGQMSSAMRHARAVVVPLGAIFQDELTAANTEHRARSKKRLLIRASCEYRKGCDLFVEALAQLTQLLPDLRERLEVVSIGDDSLSQARIDQYVDHVDKGYVKRQGLLELYRNLDVLLVSSREDAGPLMINECVALGVFVISTPIGVAGDLIVNGRNGLIAKDISASALADALMTCLQGIHADTAAAQADTLAARRRTLTFEGYVHAMMDQISSLP